jgi:MFS family permease
MRAEAEARAQGWRRTFASLSIPQFRALWISMLFSFGAMHMSFTAQGYLTYQITDSAAALGLVGLGWGLPQLVFSLIGGVAADRINKRVVVVVSQCVMFVTVLITAVLIQAGVIELWMLFLMSLVTGTVFAFYIPSRQAWIPEMVGQDKLMNAVALNSSAFTAMSIIGPGIAGVLIAIPLIDVQGTYLLMAALYAITVFMLLRIPASTTPAVTSETPHPLRAMRDGLGYVRRHPVLPVLLLMGFVPIVLGMPYRQLFPVFAEDVYGVGPVGLGLMGVAAGIGALAGALGVASLRNGSKRSMIQLVGGLGFGVSLIIFALAPSLPIALVVLVVVGVTSNGYWALNSTMVLGNSAPEYYGRVQSIYMLSWSVQGFAALPEAALADVVGVQPLMAGIGVALVIALIAIAAFVPGHKTLREHDGVVTAPA